MKSVLEKHGLSADFYLSGFGQYRQDILPDSSPFYDFNPSGTIMFLDGEDLFRDLVRQPLDFDMDLRQKRAGEEIKELESLVEQIQSRLPNTSIFLNSIIVPPLNALGMLEYNSSYSLRDAFGQFNAGLREIAHSRRRCFVIDYEQLVSWYGFQDWYDERLWYLGRIGLSHIAMQELARKYVVALRAAHGISKKCLVLDLDDTLWGGVIGTDGVDGIQLGMDGIGLAYREFQEEILNLHKRGVLLAINSKNNWDDAVETIDQHPAMVLRREHFAAMKINWQDKVTNLREIAEELNLGLDSFVFVDNSPVERAWVESQLPQVQVLALPPDPALYRRSLLELDAFVTVSLTEEDRERGQLYRQYSMVEDLRRSAVSLESFYSGLRMKAKILHADKRSISRIAQLSQKTSQFNLTTRRYTESDIEKMAHSSEHRVFSLSLTDCFGDNGLVGVAILALEADAWKIDTLLLSCRVMGRMVETAFLAFLASHARTHGARYLVGEYLPTKKNMPVRDFYVNHGFKNVNNDNRWWRIELPLAKLEVPPYIELVYENRKEMDRA